MLPTIHLNGTSGAELRDGFIEAYHSLSAAQEAMQKCFPNGRDYYPQPPDNFPMARQEHAERIQRLEALKVEMHALALHCDQHAKPAERILS